MTREPEIALVLSAESWVDALHRHCADHGGARVRCVVLDPAVALDEEFDVLVAGERWPALTRPFVDALHGRGRRVLVVGDPERGRDFACRLGADGMVSTQVGPPAMVAAALRLMPVRAEPARDVPAAGPVGTEATGATRDSGAAPFVVVGGPSGAGATEVAIALAASGVRRGARPVVVDADTVTPSIAVRLGLPLEPNLCTAVDAAGYGLGAVPGSLFDLGAGWPAVLVGVPNRRAGRALSGLEVVAVGEVLAERFRPVVFDVSAGGLEGPTDDVTAALAARASTVVAVCAASPVGVVRLVEWLDRVRAVVPGGSIHLVVNRAPSARARRAELAGELQGPAPVAGLTFVPADPRVEDAAWAAGLVHRGAFARAVATLERDLTALLAESRERGSSVLATEALDVE